jgi:hypothetical protein
MSDITKLVDRGVPSNQRSQVFTEADGGAGDVLMVKNSLGRHAQQVTIEATNAMSVRFNVYRTIFPQRQHGDGITQWWPGLDNLALGETVQDDSNALIELDAGDTFELNNEMPICDIELLTVSGAFTVIVT